MHCYEDDLPAQIEELEGQLDDYQEIIERMADHERWDALSAIIEAAADPAVGPMYPEPNTVLTLYRLLEKHKDHLKNWWILEDRRKQVLRAYPVARQATDADLADWRTRMMQWGAVQ